MSHFTVLVFSKVETINELLAPYDENMDVEEYETNKVSEEEKK